MRFLAVPETGLNFLSRRRKGKGRDSTNPASIYNWWYRGERVELVQMGLGFAIIKRPNQDPFMIGQAAIDKWLR